MSNCPICQSEYLEGKVNFCYICGWDLTPYPVTFAGHIPEAFLEKEQAKLAWGKQIWSRFLDIQDKLNQEKAFAQAQLTEVLTKLNQVGQVPAQQVTDSLAKLTEQLAKVQQQLTEAKEEREKLLIQLAEIPELEKVRQEKADLVIQLTQAKTEISRLQAELDKVTIQSQSHRENELSQLRLRLSGIETELQQAKEDRGKIQLQLSQFISQSDRTNTEEITQFQRQLSQYQSQLKVANRQIGELNSMLETERQKWQLPERKSERGVDFRKLEWLLICKNWEEADRETWNLILSISGNSSLQKGYLEELDIENISVSDFKIIDELWNLYSNGKYGFSAQWKSIKNRKQKGVILEILESPSQQGYYPAGHIIGAIGIKGFSSILMKLAAHHILQ
ncbi:GUN4 domain-containing protein [Aerosakkonema sp. BLCC-F183]|uniref:GUN4 domain-containing protein n=1 Tax=Aerosakkonema sp. BLCC-F183 TaxID=3342834 RepID=UPI0035B98090